MLYRITLVKYDNDEKNHFNDTTKTVWTFLYMRYLLLVAQLERLYNLEHYTVCLTTLLAQNIVKVCRVKIDFLYLPVYQTSLSNTYQGLFES